MVKNIKVHSYRLEEFTRVINGLNRKHSLSNENSLKFSISDFTYFEAVEVFDLSHLNWEPRPDYKLLNVAVTGLESVVNEITDSFSDYDFNSSAWEYEPINIDRLWAITSSVIRYHGWTSINQSKATGIPPTSQLVYPILYPEIQCPSQNMLAYYKSLKPNEYDVKIAKEVKEWLVNEVGKSDEYMTTLKNIAKTGCVAQEQLALAVSAVGSYLKYLEATEKRKKDKKNTSVWLGSVGERLKNISVQVYTIKYWEVLTDKKRMLVGFKDKFGNTLIWKTVYDTNVVRGENYLLSGTVKEHSLYKDTKQTIIARCTLKIPDKRQIELFNF